MCTSWHTDRYLIRSVFSIVYRWFKYLSPDPTLGINAAFFISNTQQLLKITSISTLFPQIPCTIQINVLPLQHQNPPSLSTMLK